MVLAALVAMFLNMRRSLSETQPDTAASLLGGELLAAAATARAKELATTNGGLTREKAVATLTHKIAGLESPLHCILE